MLSGIVKLNCHLGIDLLPFPLCRISDDDVDLLVGWHTG